MRAAADAGGFDHSSLAKYESGKLDLRLTTLERILDFYDATLLDLALVLEEIEGRRPAVAPSRDEVLTPEEVRAVEQEVQRLLQIRRTARSEAQRLTGRGDRREA